MTEPMKTAQLLPCPFCGTEPEWINEALPDSHYYIRCPHCKFVMKEDRRDKVVGMWSRREQVAAERERIKTELKEKLNGNFKMSLQRAARIQQYLPKNEILELIDSL